MRFSHSTANQEATPGIFKTAQLTEFGLDPRDWLLRDSRAANYSTQRLQHRDDEDIQLKVSLGTNGEIKEVELQIFSAD